MFPTMPEWYEIRGYADSREDCPKEVYGTAKTWQEAKAIRDDAESAGWLVEIIHHPANHN